MTRDEVITWLLSHGYVRDDRFLAPDNEPGWEAYASKARGRVVAVCDGEVVFVSGMFYLQGQLEHVAPDGEHLALSGGTCLPMVIRCRRSTFDVEIGGVPKLLTR